jgi:hypothetical protein
MQATQNVFMYLRPAPDCKLEASVLQERSWRRVVHPRQVSGAQPSLQGYKGDEQRHPRAGAAGGAHADKAVTKASSKTTTKDL